MIPREIISKGMIMFLKTQTKDAVTSCFNVKKCIFRSKSLDSALSSQARVKHRGDSVYQALMHIKVTCAGSSKFSLTDAKDFVQQYNACKSQIDPSSPERGYLIN